MVSISCVLTGPIIQVQNETSDRGDYSPQDSPSYGEGVVC